MKSVFIAHEGLSDQSQLRDLALDLWPYKHVSLFA